mmetsp:Transcript_1429/g.3174  ORF Transcript_1429/g.3174 Transcript_1429/m.3174 type:complete len:1018 (-) Transcript_1429:117-3170(-)
MMSSVPIEGQIARALERVRLVLDAQKDPQAAGDVSHSYEDKYNLTECMINTALASQINCLSVLGLGSEQLKKLATWSDVSAVSFRFVCNETVVYDREEKKEVESPTKSVTEIGVGALRTSITSKVTTTVVEHFWKYSVTYELFAFRGIGETEADRIPLVSRVANAELKTSSKNSTPCYVHSGACDVNITTLIKSLDPATLEPRVKIDRSSTKCKTPRRNPEVEEIMQYFRKIRDWMSTVVRHILCVFSVPTRPDRVDLSTVDVNAIFNPVIPVLDERSSEGADSTAAAGASSQALLSKLSSELLPRQSATLGVGDMNLLLQEELRTLTEQREQIFERFPTAEAAIGSSRDATVFIALSHCNNVCARWEASMAYVEDMLRKQLVAAIGKEVSPTDFAEYMRFHNQKMFGEAYAPTPFSFAVRRSSQHSPEGTLALEEISTKATSSSTSTSSSSSSTPPVQPVVSMAAHGVATSSTEPSEGAMKFALGASVEVTFGGDRYLHGVLQHQFSGQSGSKWSLSARAKQFSSMIVLVGRISSATTFDPKYAAIIQNKDELTIPLELSTIPTPKEFKEAISSLSPEQQAFAKSFRSMQLESTLFGILVIHIKPQLEKVLNLPDNSLTKEIKLTQDLMQLFIKYQIPSDLLSFDPATKTGSEPATAVERLLAVKDHVAAMMEMLKEAKDEQLSEKRMEAEYVEPISPELSECCSEEDSRLAPCFGDDMDECEDLCMEFSAPPAPVRRSGFSAMVKSAVKDATSAMKHYSSKSFEAKEGCQRLSSPSRSIPRSNSKSSTPTAKAPGQPQQQQQERQQQGQQPSSSATSSGQQQEQQKPGGNKQPSEQNQEEQQSSVGGAAGSGATAAFEARDYTEVPQELNRRFDELDTDSALRPTIINVGEAWTKRFQKSLLSKAEERTLNNDEIKDEKAAAFDLLDALTKSGAIPIDHAALHVVVAATHCFDKTVTESVVQDNLNPIERVERSSLIMASTIHALPAQGLLKNGHLDRVKAASPQLFLEDGRPEN